MKYQPNYVLNFNISIPLRKSGIQDEKSGPGEFTFSPGRLNKKLKMEIPSARTYECESRKLSNLAETQNTMSHRANRRRTAKSSETVEIGGFQSQVKKSKDGSRSEAGTCKRPASKSLKTMKSAKNA